MEPEPIIQLKDLTLSYGGADVVGGVDLKVLAGETKVILGPSGVGKSTILKAVLGLLRPQSGEVWVFGKNLFEMTEKEQMKTRFRMAMVFQNGALFDSMTVGENVGFRLREFALADDLAIEKRVREVLKFVGLEQVMALKPAQLSGGMRKRVAIARALAPHPEIFLFDEPTVGLDPVNIYNVEQLILKLKEKKENTLIIVTHDVRSACRLADSIAMLHQGKFIFEGPPAELGTCEDIRVKAFLDPAIVGSLA